MSLKFKLLRKFIREQIASSDTLGASPSIRTTDTEPYTFEDTPGYDIDISANVNGGYMLTIKYYGNKLGPVSVYNDYDEAHHQARMIIDSHRVGAMQSNGKKKSQD
jgi:hypothetical protein